MILYDIAVIGGGAAGTMAAITAARRGRKTVLLERNGSIGRKLLITGKGRCNVTNMASLEECLAAFGKEGRFFRTAFTRFSNEDLIAFFREAGLEMTVERQNRVFPADNRARSVVTALENCLRAAGVETRCGIRIRRLSRDNGTFLIEPAAGEPIRARRVILATGGASYGATGSTGDGYVMAAALGHTVSPLVPGLVPLVTKETWVKEVQGLAVKNVKIVFTAGKRKVVSGVGELLFTHFGISGPLVLDLSAAVIRLAEGGAVTAAIDLKPGISADQLDGRLLADITAHGSKDAANLMKLLMPASLAPVVTRLAGIPSGTLASQVTAAQRRSLRDILKALPLTIVGSLPLEEAMVTSGGIPHSEIDPRTMASRLVPGLYIAGEMIAGSAASGGYNLQQAFSTGYLAGEEASRDG